jgi:hypothetical protein
MVSGGGYLSAEKVVQPNEELQAMVAKEDHLDKQLWIVKPISEA